MPERDIDRILAAIENMQRDFTRFKDEDFSRFKQDMSERMARLETRKEIDHERDDEERERLSEISNKVARLEKDRSKVLGAAGATGGLIGGLITLVKHLLGG